MKTLLRLIVASALFTAIVACGQKGDLVRPAPTPAASASAGG